MLFLILFEIVVVDIHKSQQEQGPLGCTIKHKKAVPIDLSLKECRHCCSMGGGVWEQEICQNLASNHS